MEGKCGKCKYNKYEVDPRGNHVGAFACVNPDSEFYGCWTQYNDSCEDFEKRED